MNENKTAYVRMSEARQRNAQTNGRIIKPFKAEHGAKELFYNNELVSVSATSVAGVEPVYIVTGASYDHKTGTFNIKSSAMSEDQLSKYVKLTGEVVVIGPSKTHTFQTTFVSKGKFKSINDITIPKHTQIIKTTKVRGGGVLDESIIAEGFPDAIIDNSKLTQFCTVTEPRKEIGVEENE